MRAVVLLIVSCLTVIQVCYTQDHIFESRYFTEEDGLMHREINSIFQDDQGFLWLGCPRGLMRFDGYNFKGFTNDELPGINGGVWRLRKDFEGYLWLMAYDKTIVLYHPVREEFISFEEKFGKTVSPASDVKPFEIISGPGNELAFPVYTQNEKYGLEYYQPGKGLITLDLSDLGKAIPKHITERGTIWCYSHDKYLLTEVSAEGEILRQISYDYPLYWNSNGPEDYEAFWSAKDGSFRLINSSGPGKQYFPPLKPKKRNIYGNNLPDIKYIRKANIFLLDEKFFDPAKGDYIGKLGQIPSSGHSVRSVYVDRNGVIWVGGNFGLTRIVIQKNNFRNYLQLSEKFDESHFSIRGIYEKDGFLFAQSEAHGLYFQNLNNTGSEPRLLNNKGWGNFAITPVNNKEILIGGRKEIYTLDISKTGQQDELLPFKQISIDHDVWIFHQDSYGQLWIGTDKGLFIQREKDGLIERFVGGEKYKDIERSHIIHITSDSKERVWICSNLGLFRLEMGKGITGHFHKGGKSGEYLPANNFYHLFEDEDGTFWLGTAGNGLLRWHPENNQYKVFSLAEGLPNDVIYSVYPDRRGRLWMSSDFGLIVFDKKSWRVSSFQADSGLPHNEFNRVGHYQNDKGHLFYGSINGLTTFDPNQLEMKDPVADFPLVITKFQQFDGNENKLIDKTSQIKQKPIINLKPNDRYFHLEFALLNFVDSRKNKYAWKIEGLDADWHYQAERSVRLSRLPYGRQVLKVKAQIADGRWSSETIEIDIHVHKPFYATYWFLGLAALLFMIVGPAFYWLRISILKKRQLELESMVRERTARIEADKLTIEKQAEELKNLDKAKSRFFTNISHELRTPLTLILGPIGKLLKRNRLDNRDFTLVKLMQQNANNLLSMINEILDLSKLESGKLKLHLKPASIYPLMKRLLAAYESHARLQGINIIFLYKADKYLQIQLDVKKFEQIFNNLLSNALKFTSKGELIEVILEDTGSHIQFKVRDTGVGIHPDDLPHIFNRFYQSNQLDAPVEGGTGIGLAICSEYAKLFNGSLSASSEPGVGSEFMFEFPKQEVIGGIFDPGVNDDRTDDAAIDESGSLLAKGDHTDSEATILVVEDNHGLRSFLRIMLSEKYRVITAINGHEAVEVISEKIKQGGQIDLIVSDVMMPIMDGMQLLELLKTRDDFRHIPVIMLTAKAEMINKLEALRIGVDDYMIKPFEEEELLARINNLLYNAIRRNQAIKAQELVPTGKISSEFYDTGKQKTAITPIDQSWLAELENFVIENISNVNFTTDNISSEMAISRSKLFRKVKSLTGLTANQYINIVRFRMARTYLESRKYDSVKATAQAVGFKDVEYFSRQFKKQFGRLPSSYL